ncbi:MAG: YfhO family protein [Oscillospiraceae bacterium]|nr:YfhO family protein [Oscillospiraceae bacterium]
MKKFLQTVKNFIYENKSHLIAFFLPVIILFAVYAIVGIFPFGENSVLAVDFSTQYVYFFDYLRDVLSGKESLFYNWSGSLSGSFYGTFAYYIASPFDLIVLLFPRENITEGILTMLLAKIGCIGLTTSIFLRKHRRYSEYTSALFSVIFALSGYMTANTINPMWLDAVIALPIITMGIERICKKRGFLLYTLSLFFAIIANYYTGYMLCVFSGLYFIYFISSRKITRRKRKIGIFALSSASAAMMSGFMIIPAFLPLFEGKLDGGLDRLEFRESFNLLDALLKFFPTVYDTQRYGGLPFIYCGLFALIFAIAYFFCEKIALRERAAGGILCGFLLFSMYFKPLDNLWHGGRAPVWFDHRYSFLLIFMLIILGANAFESIKNVRARHIGSAFFILLGVLLVSNGFRSREFMNAQYIMLFSLILLAAAGAAAVMAKNNAKKPARFFVFGLVCLELFANTNSYISDINGNFGYQPRDSYVLQISEMREIADEIRAKDSGLYRMEKTFHRAFNDNIGAGIYGVSFSSSVYNANVLRMMREMGFGQYDWHTRYNGSTMLTDDIFGIKYIMSKNSGQVPYDEKDGIVYKNSDALPLMFLADEGIIGSAFLNLTVFDYQQFLASRLSGENEEIFTEIFDYDQSFKNLTKSGTHFTKRDTSSDGAAMYTFSAPKSGALYTYIPTEWEHTCALYVNGVYLRNYFNGFDYNTAYLGDFSEGEEICVEIKVYYDDAYFSDPIFCILDKTALESFTAKFPRNTVRKTGSCSLEVSLDAESDCALFTTIPYERGWSAYIDGKKCEIYTAVNDTLMCIKVPEGKHTITLSFVPDGFVIGLVITACGALLFAGMLLARRRKPKIKKRA